LDLIRKPDTLLANESTTQLLFLYLVCGFPASIIA